MKPTHPLNTPNTIKLGVYYFFLVLTFDPAHPPHFPPTHINQKTHTKPPSNTKNATRGDFHYKLKHTFSTEALV